MTLNSPNSSESLSSQFGNGISNHSPRQHSKRSQTNFRFVQL